MELIKEAGQSVAEHAASYKMGQTVLRQLDRALWVVEKCAKWAVPPPLDQEERPELVRPLPWVLFLGMLLALRVARETISLANLVLGKPPLRSADVVMYIQSKRRYLRTLKYTGNRVNRARSVPQTKEPWYRGIQSLFEFTMCFRRQPLSYGNNNTTRMSNNDEVLVVKRKRSREQPPVAVAAGAADSPMERLIEKMMGDLDAESDDDSSFTLTNARSDESEDSQSDQENYYKKDSLNSTIASLGSSENSMSPLHNDVASSTPEISAETIEINDSSSTHKEENQKDNTLTNEEKQNANTPTKRDKSELSKPNHIPNSNEIKNGDGFLAAKPKILSPKEESLNFIAGERCPPKQPKHKLGRKMLLALTKAFKMKKKHEKVDIMANGRSMSAPSKKKGLHPQRRPSDITDGNTADKSF